ncbi:helicase associated domain-containing protein [Streptomyces sp. NBC_00046]|uniref:helicase associated domain-containing protein n=1 Tax=Streptomyces sp. NBC_00046 TaxID=2975626 RepID=UPI002F9192FA
MLTSDAYGTLAKVLGALRAHDTETIEHLADPRIRSGSWVVEEGEMEEEAAGEREEPEGERGPSAPARELLKFSTPRDPALPAQFVKLRVIEPENTFWRRGIQVAARYVKETGAQQLRVPYDYITPDDWAPAGFPLGTWLADQRKTHKAGRLDAGRVEQLAGLGMVWSHQDVAFEEGLTAARAWAAARGHLLPPVTAVWDGYPVGTWTKNQRFAARAAEQLAQRREAGLPVPSNAGAMTEARRAALEEIDPGWCPGWQRCFRLVQNLLQDGGVLPVVVGKVIVQGEDLGRWVAAQRHGWEQLLPAQQWLLENVLGIEPAEEAERPVRRTQDDMWALNLTAARQFHGHEGHLRYLASTPSTWRWKRAREVVRAAPKGSWWPSSACGSTTSANAPTGSPNSAGPTSTSSACAGKGGRNRGSAGMLGALCSSPPLSSGTSSGVQPT